MAAGICFDRRLRVPMAVGIVAVVKSQVTFESPLDAVSVEASVLTVRIVSVDPVDDSVPASRLVLPAALIASPRSFWISSRCSSM